MPLTENVFCDYPYVRNPRTLLNSNVSISFRNYFTGGISQYFLSLAVFVRFFPLIPQLRPTEQAEFRRAGRI